VVLGALLAHHLKLYDGLASRVHRHVDQLQKLECDTGIRWPLGDGVIGPDALAFLWACRCCARGWLRPVESVAAVVTANAPSSCWRPPS
jgi:hypothetical protein